MRLAGTLLSGMAGLAGLGWLLVSAPVAHREMPSPAARSIQEAAPPPVVERRVVRGIAPDRFASPLADAADGLVRIEPRRPMREDKEIRRAAVVMFPRPKSLEAGLLEVSGGTLKLRGVLAMPVEHVCVDGEGRQWPCGRMALTQQRLFIRNRTLTCAGTATTWTDTRVTDCSVGNADLAAWLAANGWVEAEEGSHLAILTRKARAEKRGLWGADPRNRREEPPLGPPWP